MLRMGYFYLLWYVLQHNIIEYEIYCFHRNNIGALVSPVVSRQLVNRIDLNL